MFPRRHRARTLTLLVAPLVALAACGGSSSPNDAQTSSTTATTEEPTTLPSVTTTSVPASTTAASATTGAAPAASEVSPLTGLAPADPATLTRPAMAVKIDNHPDARPQAGLNQADIVYEEIVEGITRFFTIFQSTDAGPIGPIRSARTTDVNLLNQLNRPFLVWSGGNAKVVAAIAGANAESRAHGQAPGFYRDAERRKHVDLEHTLFNEGTQTIYATATPAQAAPSPFFTYGTPTGGDPVSKITMKMNSVPVEWTWDAGQGLFIRSEYGAAHIDAAGVPIGAQNVVVQFIDYKTSAADPKSPEAITVGQGDALVYTAGKVTLGHWDRPDAIKPATFTDGAGQPVVLTPGRTWIELAEAGVTTVTAA